MIRQEREKAEPGVPFHTPILIGILLLALILRIGWPGITEFKFDEAGIARQSLSLIHDGVWPTGVLADISLPHPPLITYLLAIPLSITRNPALASAFMGLLGVLSVWLTYRLGAQYYDQRVGLIAAALFALSPWAIFFSRKIWAQNIPALTLASMLALSALIVDRKPKAVIWSLIVLGGLLGVYLGDAIFAVIVVVFVALHIPSIKQAAEIEGGKKFVLWTLLGVGGLLILVLPYAMEFITGRTDLASMGSMGGDSGGTLSPIDRLRFAAHIATGYQYHALAGDRFQDFYSTLWLPESISILDKIQLWLIVAGMLYVVFKALVQAVRHFVRNYEGYNPTTTLLALWIVLPTLMWMVLRLDPALVHRYILLYPVQLLAVGIMLVDLIDWVGSRWMLPARALLVPVAVWITVLGIWQVTEYIGMLRYVSTTSIYGGHGRPVRELWGTASLVRQYAKADGLPVVVYTTGDDPDQDGGAAVFDALLGDLDLVLVGGDGIEVMPSRDYVSITQHADGDYSLQLNPPPDTSGYSVMTRLANGIDLLEVSPSILRSLIEPDGRLRLTLTWGVWSLPPSDDDYSISVQLFTDDGLRRGQTDVHFVRSTFWHTGDLITTSISLPVDADAPVDGNYELVIAMYSFVSETESQGVDILDEAGNPAGQLIVIPLD